MISLKFDTLLLHGSSRVDVVDDDHFLAVGCSHTAGIGVEHNECYVAKLEAYYDTKIYNLAVPGGNHTFCNLNILSWLAKGFKPRVIIAQWPHPIRRLGWLGPIASLCNINSRDAVFDRMLEKGEQNFYADWLLTIFNVNEICKSRNIKIINILLEDIDDRYNRLLLDRNIVLHQDKKIPGQTWFFDQAGNDMLHHSERCHEQWKTRLIGLIDENTPR